MISTPPLDAHPDTSLTAERFEALVNQSLTVIAPGGVEAWRVVDVKRKPAHSLRADQPFNVYLSAPPSANNRAQGMRRAKFADGETFEFFAVPIAATATEISFEVIFN